MALSDEERRRLEKLEQELAAADPELDRHLQTGRRTHRVSSSLMYAILTVIAGLALVLMGVGTHLVVLGASGFLLAVAAVAWYVSGLLSEGEGERRSDRPADGSS